jgi:hypothetical protein
MVIHEKKMCFSTAAVRKDLLVTLNPNNFLFLWKKYMMPSSTRIAVFLSRRIRRGQQGSQYGKI